MNRSKLSVIFLGRSVQTAVLDAVSVFWSGACRSRSSIKWRETNHVIPVKQISGNVVCSLITSTWEKLICFKRLFFTTQLNLICLRCLIKSMNFCKCEKKSYLLSVISNYFFHIFPSPLSETDIRNFLKNPASLNVFSIILLLP